MNDNECPVENQREKTTCSSNGEYPQLRILLDSIHDSILIINCHDFSIMGANRYFLEEVGLSEKEVIGRTCHELTHQSDCPCNTPEDMCPLHETLATGKPAAIEHVHYLPDGEKVFVEITTTPLIDDRGNIDKVLHITRDITTRRKANDALLESVERYRNLFDNTQDGVYWTDANGIFTLINRAGAEMLGHKSPEELIGRPAVHYWANPGDRVEFVEIMKREKIARAYHMRAKRADGSESDLEATSRMLVDENGNFSGIEGILRDFTERKQAEETLHKKQDELLKKHEELGRLFRHMEMVKKEWERTMDCAGNIIILADREGRIKRFNRALKEFIGRPYEDILWYDWTELLAEHGMTTETFYGQGIELFHEPTGRWFALNTYPVTDGEDSEISGNVITMHDSTELKQVSLELEQKNREVNESRTKLQNALNEISSLIIQVMEKKDFSVQYANAELKTCWKEKKCDKTECPCHGKKAGRCWQVAGTYCGGKVQGVFATKFKNCSECSVFRESAPDPICQIGEHFNNMMHILEMKGRELEGAYSQLKDTQSQILQQEKMASIGQLAAGVAHEINNPMGFISSNLSTLEKYTGRFIDYIQAQAALIETLSPAQAVLKQLLDKRKQLKLDYIIDDIRSLITESLDGADRVKKIVQDLKGFSRVDEAETKIADINSGIESTINIVWNELKYKVTLRKEYGDIPPTKCNPGQLNQVFMNMLVNAAHAIEKQGEIAVKTWSEDGNIFVSIADNGSGIPQDKISRIFEPFFTTKEVGKGTGLGLSIAYDIVKKHNGEIAVESEVGKGTKFTVRIPCADSGE